MELRSSTCLVTGAAGFIGSHLAQSLLEDGCAVIGLDSFTDYYDPDLKEDNVKELREYSGFELVRGDLNELDLGQYLDQVDCVFHLAAQAGVRASWGDEFEHYLRDNIRATQTLLESIKTTNRPIPVSMASSSSVYGIPESLPMREDMKCDPFSPYGVTKLSSEQLGMLYYENFDIPVTALRLFTVYGPRQRPDMAFNRFLRWILGGEEITIYGDGEQTRDFTYVADVVEAFKCSVLEDGFGDVYNVGGGTIASVNEIIDIMSSVTSKAVKTTHEPMPSGDVPHTDADTTKIKDQLDWSPEVNLKQGIEEEWKWVRERENRLTKI